MFKIFSNFLDKFRTGANVNVKKYGHFISLGYNCETAYQFFLYHHFVESSLFTWTNTINISNLIFALNDLDKLSSNGVQLKLPMWECLNTHIRFHGRMKNPAWKNPQSLSKKLSTKIESNFCRA